MNNNDDETPFRQKGWPGLRGRLFHLYFRLRRPMTLGVRGLVHNRADDTVFLIRHTYVPGWQLPGGGVEAGETMEEALARELMEEGNIELRAQPALRSMHFNRQASRRDHVAFYLITAFKQATPRLADREIAEAAFFPRNALPPGTTPATFRRLAEVFDGVTPGADW
jgi:ADP-ribose pyrophosphatase YjhB (NUDIX family)